MKLASYSRNPSSGDSGSHSYGVVKDDGIIDLGSRLGDKHATLHDLLRHDAVKEAQEIADAHSPDLALSDIVFERPIQYPEKIVCVGVNYMNRNEEYKDQSNRPEKPSIFMRTPDSLVGHGQPLHRPPESEQLDYEGEIVIVIGREGRRIKEADAQWHIAGLTIMNEGSVRDWLRHAKFNVTQGKNFPHSGGIGPWMVTADEIPGYDDLTVTTRVNGEQRQHDTTANLAFPFRHLISYISTWAILKPGDIIATGTPTGAGARFDPPKYLKPGDVVEVEVSHVGTLSNPVIDEPIG